MSKSKRPFIPAFPSEQGTHQDGTWNQTYDPGMSLRDYFAGQALAGLCSAQDSHGTWQGDNEATAEAAYELADWMMDEREYELADWMMDEREKEDQ